MTRSVLGSLALSYQPLWDQQRRIAGVQLFLDTQPETGVDAAHIVSALDSFNFQPDRPLLLSSRPGALLADLLTQTPTGAYWIGVPEEALHDTIIQRRAREAWQRGVRLFWAGGPGSQLPATLAPCFTRSLLSLSPQEALACLRLSLRKSPLAPRQDRQTPPVSPVQAGQIYADVPSALLADHCLDQHQAWALAGWPLEEVLHGARQSRSQPDRRVILRLLDQLAEDGYTEPLEPTLQQDPVLCYRLLRFANSAALGLRTPVGSLRPALQLIGHAPLKTWLQEQLPVASAERNLRPVRSAMALHARLMAALLEAGDSDELRDEVQLCGLLSHLDLLLGEPLQPLLERLPLPEVITETLLRQTGPVLPLLEMASALEQTSPLACAQTCAALNMDPQTVNQALLHCLSQLG